MTTHTPPFVLLDLNSGEQFAGETRTEIVDQVVSGHGTVPPGARREEIRFELRADALVAAANRAQAVVLADVDTAEFEEDVLSALFHDRESETLELEEWPEDLPVLFAIASNYAPYTQLPQPKNVILLDPFTETTFLEALEKAGLAQLYEIDAATQAIEDAFAD